MSEWVSERACVMSPVDPARNTVEIWFQANCLSFSVNHLNAIVSHVRCRFIADGDVSLYFCSLISNASLINYVSCETMVQSYRWSISFHLCSYKRERSKTKCGHSICRLMLKFTYCIKFYKYLIQSLKFKFKYKHMTLMILCMNLQINAKIYMFRILKFIYIFFGESRQNKNKSFE